MGRILILAVMAVFGLVAVKILLVKPIDSNNSKTIEGHFRNIERIEYKSSYSYNLYVQEQQNYYKISADDAGCFFYDFFIRKAKEGQPIKITIANNELFGRPSVCSLDMNGANFLSTDCVNQRISDRKSWMPLCMLAFIVIMSLYLYFNNKKKVGKIKVD